MASTACFLHHCDSLDQLDPLHRVMFACSSQPRLSAGTKKRCLALTLLVGAAAVGSKVSPADAAYGEAANVFGKPKENRGYLPYSGEGFKLSIPSKWNPSKEVRYPGQVLGYQDDFDANSNVIVAVTPTDKNSIGDYGSPEEFLSTAH